MRIVRVQERHPVLIHALLDIWERSVRATHLFLSDGEIENIKEYVPQALMGVENLTIAENEDGQPVAFMGTENGTLGNAVHRPGRKGQGSGQAPSPLWDRPFWRKGTGGQRAEPAGKGFLRAHGFFAPTNERSATNRAAPIRSCTCACGRKMALFRSDAGKRTSGFLTGRWKDI